MAGRPAVPPLGCENQEALTDVTIVGDHLLCCHPAPVVGMQCEPPFPSCGTLQLTRAFRSDVERAWPPVVDAQCCAAVQVNMAHFGGVFATDDLEHRAGPKVPDGYGVGAHLGVNGCEYGGIGFAQVVVAFGVVHRRIRMS